MQVRSFVLAVLALLPACSSPGLDADPRLLWGPLTVDREFSRAQQQDILAAVELWRQATGARFAPEVHIGEVRCGQPFAIEAVHSESCHIGQQVPNGDEQRPPQRVLGAAHPDDHWISVVTWLKGDAFRNNVAHELGHYLLVGHGDGIMAQARDNEPPVVAGDSISEFCAIWRCDEDASKAAE